MVSLGPRVTVIRYDRLVLIVSRTLTTTLCPQIILGPAKGQGGIHFGVSLSS